MKKTYTADEITQMMQAHLDALEMKTAHASSNLDRNEEFIPLTSDRASVINLNGQVIYSEPVTPYFNFKQFIWRANLSGADIRNMDMKATIAALTVINGLNIAQELTKDVA